MSDSEVNPTIEAVSENDLRDALRSIDRYSLTEEWNTVCQQEYALRDGPRVDVDAQLPSLLMLAAEVELDITETPERALIDGILDFLDSRPSAGVAIRQLVCLGYCISKRLMYLGIAWEIVALASRRTALTVDQALAIMATWSLQSVSQEARRDALTGLSNRRAWEEDLSESHDNARAVGTSYCVVSADLDGLKRVNDLEGHKAGDALIKRMADALQAGARPEDGVYRWGGDEFWLLMPNCTATVAAETMSHVADTGPEFSFGIAEYPADGNETSDLNAVADARMYVYKEAKKAKKAAKD
jgi:diguanylate cyclase (GGDEF)-like protein